MKPAAPVKLLRCLGILKIPRCKIAFYAQFAFFSVRDRIHVIIEKCPFKILIRLADRSLLIRFVYLKMGNGTQGFTHAVVINETVTVFPALAGELFASRHDNL